MAKIMDSITTETIEQIDEFYNKNKKMPAKTVSQIITNILTKYDKLSDDEKEIGKNIICKLSEKNMFPEACITKIARQKIFPDEQDQLWLKNLCNNGYVIQKKLVEILKYAYYHIIFESNNVEKITTEISKIYPINYKLLSKLLKEKNIIFHIEDSEYWRQIYTHYNYDNNHIDLFPITRDYLCFLISLDRCYSELKYSEYIKDKIITKFSDIFPNGNNVLNKKVHTYTIQHIINKLIENNIIPKLEELEKFETFGYYKDSKNIVNYFLKNKLINKLSEFTILYGKISCTQLDAHEIINLCIANNITLDANYIEYVSYRNSMDDKLYDLHKINISKLMTGENLDISKLIYVACENCDEILFNQLIEHIEENNITEDKIFINTEKLLDAVMLKIKSLKCPGINILKKLLNMKAEPKKEHIKKILDVDLIKLLISYGLQIDDETVEIMIKNDIVIDYDELGYSNPEKIYEYCDKYNFFPKEYEKYFTNKMKAHVSINNFFDMYRTSKNKLTEDDIIKIIEENKIVPKTELYEKAVLQSFDKLVTYLEEKHKMCPGYTLMFKMTNYIKMHQYMHKFIEYHNLSHLSELQLNIPNV